MNFARVQRPSLSRKGLSWSARLLVLVAASCGVISLAQAPSELPDGITLPARGGVYAINRGVSGNELVRLHPVEVKQNAHTGANLMRGMVYSGPRTSVELDGLNAQAHLHGSAVSVLVQVGDDNMARMREELAIVRLKQTADSRIVSTASQNVFGGQHRRGYDVVATTKTSIGEDGWIRLTPDQPLGPGEYGLIQLPKDIKLLPGEVYDFDVDFDQAKPDQKASPNAGR